MTIDIEQLATKAALARNRAAQALVRALLVLERARQAQAGARHLATLQQSA